jgi:hypothetical protein
MFMAVKLLVQQAPDIHGARVAALALRIRALTYTMFHRKALLSRRPLILSQMAMNLREQECV